MLHGHFAYAQTPPVPQQPEKPNTDTNSVMVGELHIHNIPLLYLNHTSKSCGYMEVSGEVLQLCKVFIYYYKSHQNLSQVLQVTCTASERSMKSKVRMIR